jgi:hypothetical protein
MADVRALRNSRLIGAVVLLLPMSARAAQTASSMTLDLPEDQPSIGSHASSFATRGGSQRRAVRLRCEAPWSDVGGMPFVTCDAGPQAPDDVVENRRL